MSFDGGHREGTRARSGTRAALAVSTAIVLATLAGPALAEGLTLEKLVQIAQSSGESSHAFDIPAQPLATALMAFTRQTGLDLVFDGALDPDLRSPGVSGSMTARSALERLIAGSGLSYSFSGDTTVTLRRPPEAEEGAVVLDPVSVEGEGIGETAWGPVEGYVARRSATGSKTDTPISKIPQSISVVTRDQIEARGAETVGEALAYTAGVRTGARGDSAGLGGDNISIRGFGGNGTAGASDNEYWDGLKVSGTNFATSSFDPYLFERIEVLKGPTSVLYGQNQPGGLVNRVSKRPPGEPQYEVVLRGGSHDHIEGGIDLGMPLDSEGHFLGRIVGLYTDREAQTDYTGLRRKAVAPSFTWQPDEDTSLTLLAAYQKDSIDGGFVKYVPGAGSVFDNPNGEIDRSFFTGDPNYDSWERQFASLGAQLEHRFNPVFTLRQNAHYHVNALEFESIYASGIQADFRTLNRTAFGVVEHADNFAIDNQLQADFGTGPVTHTLLFGLDYQWLQHDTKRRFSAAPTLDLFDPIYRVAIAEPPVYQQLSTETNQIGLYAQDQIEWENIILTLGGRQDWAGSVQKNELTDVDGDQYDDAFTGRAGLGYQFDFGLTPYVSYAESFEPSSDSDFSGNAFQPMTGVQYEAGFKYEPPGQQARVTLSAFHLTQQNVGTPDPVNPGFSIQTGEVRSRGIELEGVASDVLPGLDLSASYTFLNQVITQSNDTDKGNRLTGIPEHSASAWADYTLQEGALEGLGFGGGLRYVGSTFGDTDNTFLVSEHLLLDSALHYDAGKLDERLEGLDLALNVSNLLDKRYVASCISTTRCYFGHGRTILATMKYSW